MDSVTDVRGALIDFVRADLVGPAHGRDEVIEDPPYVKYAAGVLFPQESKVDESGSVRGVEADDGEDSDGGFDDDIVETEGASLPDQTETREDGEVYDEAVRLANQYKPSAIALTFAIPEAVRHLDIAIIAAEYDGETRSSADGRRQNRVWKRRELSLDPIRLPLPGASIEHHSVADGLKFCLLVSDKPVRHIVTASLYNDTEAGGGDTRTFYQVGFSVSCAESGCELVEYSDSEHAMAFDDEELSLEMIIAIARVSPWATAARQIGSRGTAVGRHRCAQNLFHESSFRLSNLDRESLPISAWSSCRAPRRIR